MKLHKFFSLKRFGRLLAADLRLNSKRYLYTIAGAAVGIYLLLLFSILSGQRNTFKAEDYSRMFGFSLLALGVYIGSAFPSFSEKATTANFLLFPASNFEKLISQFLLYFIDGTIIFIFLFWLDAHLVRLSLSNMEMVRNGNLTIIPFSYPKMFEYISSNSRNILESILPWIMTISIGFFLFTTRLVFNKFALAKSIISGIVIFFLVFCLLVLCSHLFYPETTYGFRVSDKLFFYSTNIFNIRNVESIILFFYILCGIIFLFFLPLAYFKIKEKQV